MIPKKLSTTELEAVYDLLAEALDAVPEEHRLLYLAKLSLVLANMVGSTGQVAAAVKAASDSLQSAAS
jgi:hypothetical protein